MKPKTKKIITLSIVVLVVLVITLLLYKDAGK